MKQSLAYSCSRKEVAGVGEGAGTVKRDKSGEEDMGQTMQGLAGQGKKFLFYCNYIGKPLKGGGNDHLHFYKLLREQKINIKKLGSYCRILVRAKGSLD